MKKGLIHKEDFYPGKMFGLYKVIEVTDIRGKNDDIYIKCECTGCGRTNLVRAWTLRNGHSRQCHACGVRNGRRNVNQKK